MKNILNYLKQYEGDNISIYKGSVDDDIYLQDIRCNYGQGEIEIVGYDEIEDKKKNYIIKEKNVSKVISNPINVKIIYNDKSSVILENW